jgi:hypothetical protein
MLGASPASTPGAWLCRAPGQGPDPAHLIVARAHVDRLILNLLLADNEDVVVLGELVVADLLLQRLGRVVEVAVIALLTANPIRNAQSKHAASGGRRARGVQAAGQRRSRQRASRRMHCDLIAKDGLDLGTVGELVGADGDDGHLPGRQPEGPLAGKMLD